MSRWGGSERDREKHREQERLNRERLAREAEAERALAAQKAAQDNKPAVVQLDGLVLLKIINHSRESLPDVVSGQLLGLDIGGKLEVTHSFPFPLGLSEEASDQYQLDMMRHLRTVNVDNNTVGWYQSAYLGTFFDLGLLDAQYTYQKHIPNSVVVVYDPFQTAKGRLVLRAYRLSDAFMSVYSPPGEKGKFSYEDLNRMGVSSSDIFESVPIKVHNSHLVHGFLYELREEKHAALTPDTVEANWAPTLNRLNLGYSAFLEKSLASLGAAIEGYSMEQGKFQFFLRQTARARQAQADYLKRRASENEARIAAGKDPLPEEDLSKNPLFRNVHKPSRMDTNLLANQIDYYAGAARNQAEQAFQKLYLVEALQKKKVLQQQAAAKAEESAQQ